MVEVVGVRFSPSARLTDLVERHGGTLDPSARSLSVERIAPIDAASALDLAPLTSRRHLAAASACPAVLLVDVALAPHVREGRRWVHEHASWALAGLLAE